MNDVRAALITSRGDTLALYQGVWHPVEKLPTDAQAEAARIAVPVDKAPKLNLKAAQALPPGATPSRAIGTGNKAGRRRTVITMGGRVMSEKRWKPQYCGICGKRGARLVGCDPFCPTHPGADVFFTPPPEAGRNNHSLSLERMIESEVVRMR